MSLAVRFVRPLAVIVSLGFVATLAANDPAGIVEARFTDGSTLRLTLKDTAVEVTTPYGKLSIPIGEIQKIEFATRLTDDATKRIEEAVANLAHPLFPKREAASAELLKLREKSYAALLEAARSKDAEVVRRANELLDSLREVVPAENLEVRKFDVIQTEHSKISGRIEGASLRAASAQFGPVQLKLTDMRSLRIPGLPDEEVKVVHADPDPGALTNYQDKVGKSFHFKVTGANTHTIWGDGIYTTDSQLATVAVHAGVLQVGQTGIVRVTIVASPPTFGGSTKNGVTSQPYGMFPAAYKVSK
jgi:LCCL domain